MLSKFFEPGRRVDALRDNPAGGLFEGFAQVLSEAGYTTGAARRHLRAAEHFIYWTRRRGIPLQELNEQSLARFDQHLSRCRCPNYDHGDPLRVTHCTASLWRIYERPGSSPLPPSRVVLTIRPW